MSLVIGSSSQGPTFQCPPIGLLCFRDAIFYWVVLRCLKTKERPSSKHTEEEVMRHVAQLPLDRAP